MTVTGTKTTTSARVVADSVAEVTGQRLTTIEVTLHRWVLAELNTHRVFSRNSASSRAIPVEKQVERVVNDPAWPTTWPAEQRGMQGGGELEGDDWDDARMLFADVKAETQRLVQNYLDSHPDKSTRLHKQYVNRLLEPFMWHTVIVTASDWEGFWKQRCSELAQPEIHLAADAMREAWENSDPTALKPGEWHMPYLPELEGGYPHDVPGDFEVEAERAAYVWYGWEMNALEAWKRISVARCARVSYLTHDGERDLRKDFELYDRLVSADPPHASPLEHVATPCPDAGRYPHVLQHKGNFNGWDQLRHKVLAA